MARGLIRYAAMARRRFGNAPRINTAADGPGSGASIPKAKISSTPEAEAAQIVPGSPVESGVHTKDSRTNDAPDDRTLGGLLAGRPAFVGVRAEAPVLDAARALASHRLRAVAVIDRGSVVGVITERAIVRRVVAFARDPGAVRCDEIMSGDVVISYSMDTPERGLRLLRDSGRKHLIVIEGQDPSQCRILGLLSATELVEKAFFTRVPSLARVSTPPPEGMPD
jgi:CBS domain-containing protein